MAINLINIISSVMQLKILSKNKNYNKNLTENEFYF